MPPAPPDSGARPPLLAADALASFSPLFERWFRESVGVPTAPQREGWPAIQAGTHTLVVSPTGTGKTLAAFYACLDDLYRALLGEGPPAGVHTLYVSPLKALNNDIHRNLQAPLSGLADLARREGLQFPPIRTAVRTGDTPQKDRQAMVRKPPHVLITTPESLFLMLLAPRAREFLASVRFVIVDEIHALAGTKRGVHLAVSLERLAALAERDPVRIGLSATVRPVAEVARFLGGDRPVKPVEVQERKRLDLAVVSPGRKLTELDGGTVWDTLFPKLHEVVSQHTTTLVFSNNRRLAERVAARLNSLEIDPRSHPELSRDHPRPDVVPGFERDKRKARQFHFEFVRAHHGSMSREARLEMEALLKDGRLRGLVATSSLELGIDVGAIDCVALLGSPKGVARGLQRVGRAGHSVGETAKGRFYPMFREDLTECAVIARAMLDGDVEETRAPENALDVLAQQVVGEAAAALASKEGPVALDELFRVVRRAHPYRNLTRRAFEETMEMLAGKYPSREFRHLAARLSWDRKAGTATALPSALLLARENAGTIPDRGYYGCYLAADGSTKIGELDEEFVFETRLNDVFLLGSQTWRVAAIERDRVLVIPAPGEPPRMPFWRGEATWRDAALSLRIARFRREVEARLDAPDVTEWLAREYLLDRDAGEDLVASFARMREAVGGIPSDRLVVVESFRDEVGDPRVVVHAPFGGRVNGPWAIAIASRLRQALDAEVQSVANDDGILLRFPNGEAPAPERVLREVTSESLEDVLLAEMDQSPVFAARFRENAERALLLPKAGRGRRTPLWLQRLRAMDLLAVARRHPDFPVLIETFRDVLTDVMDRDALLRVLRGIEDGEIRVLAVETDEPSPFASGLLLGFVAEYFYEGSERPEERARLLTLNRDLLADVLGKGSLRKLLRADALVEVESELAHGEREPRTPEELHHRLLRFGAQTPGSPQEGLLLAQGRAVELPFPDGTARVAAIEDVDLYRRAWSGDAESARALVARVLRAHGPVTTREVAREAGLADAIAERALHAIVAEGHAVLGEFRPDGDALEWCDRENLSRARRRTLAKLRKEIEAVPLDAYARFLLRWHRLDDPTPAGGPSAVRDALRQLEGLPLPGEVWEREILRRRLARFDPAWLSPLTESGEVAWVGTGERARFRPIFRSRAGLFLEPDAPAPPGTEPVVAALREHGALHFADLRAATGLEPGPLAGALATLATAGLATNDHAQVMRELMRGARRATRLRPGEADAERGVPTRYGSAGRRLKRRARIAFGRAAKAGRGTASLGRWALVRTPLRMGAPIAPHAKAEEIARVLLARYGVVAREIAEREALAPWQQVADALKLMEMRGDVRRGHFVDGLSGLQFALPAAVDALRSVREPDSGPARVVVLSALDPANPFGTGLDAGLRARDGAPLKVTRAATSHVAISRGRVVLASDATALRVTTAEGASDAEIVAGLRALAALADLPADVRPRSRVTVETLDGERATAERPRALLAAAGFEAEAGRMVYRRIV